MSFQDPQSQHIFYRKLWEEVGHFITSSSKSNKGGNMVHSYFL